MLATDWDKRKFGRRCSCSTYEWVTSETTRMLSSTSRRAVDVIIMLYMQR